MAILANLNGPMLSCIMQCHAVRSYQSALLAGDPVVALMSHLSLRYRKQSLRCLCSVLMVQVRGNGTLFCPLCIVLSLVKLAGRLCVVAAGAN